MSPPPISSAECYWWHVSITRRTLAIVTPTHLHLMPQSWSSQRHAQLLPRVTESFTDRVTNRARTSNRLTLLCPSSCLLLEESCNSLRVVILLCVFNFIGSILTVDTSPMTSLCTLTALLISSTLVTSKFFARLASTVPTCWSAFTPIKSSANARATVTPSWTCTSVSCQFCPAEYVPLRDSFTMFIRLTRK